jgi:predicted peptidase
MNKTSLVSTLVLSGLASWAMAQPPTRPDASPTSDLAQQPQSPGAKGDQQRHYFFEAAAEEMPYRLYVPRSYDANVAAPLIVALHGYGGNQNYFFDSVSELPALCERYGIVFAAPMGFATDGWYGAPLSIPGAAPRSGGGPTPVTGRSPDEESRYRALSEQDVLNVLAIVQREYNVDPDRIYLMGHSMGGFGTWWLGQKYASTWAAIAPMSGVLPNVDYQLPKLEAVPVMVSIGGAETPAWVEASRRQVDAMKAMGMTADYFEAEGATHGGMIAPTTPRVFEFLAKHKRSRRTSE